MHRRGRRHPIRRPVHRIPRPRVTQSFILPSRHHGSLIDDVPCPASNVGARRGEVGSSPGERDAPDLSTTSADRDCAAPRSSESSPCSPAPPARCAPPPTLRPVRTPWSDPVSYTHLTLPTI